MSIFEIRELAYFMVFCSALAAVLAWISGRARPTWSNRKIILVSASPLPALVIVLCMVVFLNAALSSKAACGVDACAMAMMAASFVTVYALFAFCVAVATAAIIRGFSEIFRRRRK